MREKALFHGYRSLAAAAEAEEEAILDMADRQPGWVKCRFCITRIDRSARRDICRFCFRSMQEQDRMAKALER